MSTLLRRCCSPRGSIEQRSAPIEQFETNVGFKRVTRRASCFRHAKSAEKWRRPRFELSLKSYTCSRRTLGGDHVANSLSSSKIYSTRHTPKVSHHELPFSSPALSFDRRPLPLALSPYSPPPPRLGRSDPRPPPQQPAQPQPGRHHGFDLVRRDGEHARGRDLRREAACQGRRHPVWTAERGRRRGSPGDHVRRRC